MYKISNFYVKFPQLRTYILLNALIDCYYGIKAVV